MPTTWTSILVRLNPTEAAALDTLATRRNLTRAATAKRCIQRVLAAETQPTPDSQPPEA